MRPFNLLSTSHFLINECCAFTCLNLIIYKNNWAETSLIYECALKMKELNNLKPLTLLEIILNGNL